MAQNRLRITSYNVCYTKLLRFRRAFFITADFFHDCGNMLALNITQRPHPADATTQPKPRTRTGNLCGKVILRQRITVTQNNHPLDSIFKLTHITRPWVSLAALDK